MWRAALPCRHVGIALLGSIVAAALVVGASPSSSAAAPAATAGQVWALALPDSVKTVEQKQMRWLAARGVTTIVAFKRPQASLKRLAASAKKSGLVVIAPKQVAPKKACKSAAGSSLLTCAVVVTTPAAAVRLARRGLVDYVVIRVKTPLQLRMLRGSHAKRSRIVAILPLNQKAAGPRSLARRHRLRRRRPRARPRSHVGAGRRRPARHLPLATPAHENGGRRGAGSPHLAARHRPLDLERDAPVDRRGRRGGRLRRLHRRHLRAERQRRLDHPHRASVRPLLHLRRRRLRRRRCPLRPDHDHHLDGRLRDRSGRRWRRGRRRRLDRRPAARPRRSASSRAPRRRRASPSPGPRPRTTSESPATGSTGTAPPPARRSCLPPPSPVSPAARRTRSPSTPTTPSGTAPARPRSPQPRAPAPAAGTRRLRRRPAH